MLLIDVNVYVYAHRRESFRHQEYLDWLEDRLSGEEPVGVSEMVLSSFLRIVTNHRIFRDPTPLNEAIEFCESVLQTLTATPVRPGPRHWPIFTGLCRTVSARANVVPDAYLGALAIEHGATLVTVDRGFARFPGLRLEAPLQA
ncbi:MAG: type II toxin-antitoxin system VapC family toxin [Actinomycetota bacterium]